MEEHGKNGRTLKTCKKWIRDLRPAAKKNVALIVINKGKCCCCCFFLGCCFFLHCILCVLAYYLTKYFWRYPISLSVGFLKWNCQVRPFFKEFLSFLGFPLKRPLQKDTNLLQRPLNRYRNSFKKKLDRNLF